MYSKVWPRVLAGAIATAIAGGAMASSHREAPFISLLPKEDGTDFYMFNSYESGRTGYVTFIANYQPFESPQGGPNYYPMDPNALYEIMIDNNGDAKEDFTFQFRFTNTLEGLTVPVDGKNIPVPLQIIAPVTTVSDPGLNTEETYTVTMVTGDRRTGTATLLTDSATGNTNFPKPLDNVGNKTFSPAVQDYATYANEFIRSFNVPGCMISGAQATGRVFVGQRQDPFVINVGEIFDLINIKYPAEELYTMATGNPGVQARNLAPNSLAGLSVTSIAIEIPAQCLTANGDPVIGGWTTASVRQAQVFNPVPQSSKSEALIPPGTIGSVVAGGAWTQVSRLGMPLENEVIIGVPDKDLWNSTPPALDAKFNDYINYPSLPVLVQALFNLPAPNVYPRADLVEVFNMGIPGVNQPKNLTVPAEMLRLNTSTPPTPVGSQSNLGVLANPEENFPKGDAAGFPNGRRPIDDVIDIELRVAEGALLTPMDGSKSDPDPASDETRSLHYTDGAEPNAGMYLGGFPYLNVPAGGAPTSAND
jgi:hypothetical protein